MKKILVLLILLFSLNACYPKVYTNSLIDQRKKHTQKVTSKDISKGRIFIFTCIGLGLWISANVVKND
jgi:hypothetical protein